MRTNQEIAASMREQLSTAFIEQASGLRSDINEVVQRVFEAGLAESNAELKRDRERLDWLLQDNVIRFEESYHDRQAIDEAISKENQNKQNT